VVWIATGVLLGAVALRRFHKLGALVGRGTGALARLAGLREGRARVAAHVLSDNTLRAPLSNRPCVFWHGVRVGPGVRVLEKGGGEVAVADASGLARVDLGSAVTFIRNDRYTELPAPDWSLYMETFVAQGDELYIAGPVQLEPDPAAEHAYRPGSVSPIFRGTPEEPLIVTTQQPAQVAAELEVQMGMAATLITAGLLLLWQLAGPLAAAARYAY
jgi:hypothetical protein